MDLSSTLAGLGLGLSLIVAIGAQNVFVLRQGIRREHVFAVAAVCAISDAVLILAGVSGIGAVLTAVPWLVDVVRWAGAAFLAGYAVLAAKRAIRPSGATLGPGASTAAPSDGTPDGAAPSTGPAATAVTAGTLTAAPARPTRDTGAAAGTTLLATLGTCLALTWLNPHVYLDTVFLLGSVANGHGEGRWWFALGAALGSVLWFFGLAYGARLLGRVLSTPRAWRILDGVIAVVMLALAVSLVLPR
ncbi:LysE/ArgO family amino acid transporter [Agromyces mediolanus]|uniref:LysE/ArgO family amino acid transporter n=1 Tax=Agromyces mediolanus TaxID=41986 RepID=UPI00203B4257|nr:LysE/ArgO family amino acid transporter [Agromyces mediolanus]MCM3657891.1 LysE/ArgO family amino acid transporter [Agromyces mediolanus]